jgi:hypothetical protein
MPYRAIVLQVSTVCKNSFPQYNQRMANVGLISLNKESTSCFITSRSIRRDMSDEFSKIMDDACQIVCGKNNCNRQIFPRGDNLVISGRDIGHCSMLNNLRFHHGRISFRFYYQCQENCPFVLAIRNRLNQESRLPCGFCLPVGTDIYHATLENKLATSQSVNGLRARIPTCNGETRLLEAEMCCTQADYSGLPQLADEHGFRRICLLSNIPNAFIVLTH